MTVYIFFKSHITNYFWYALIDRYTYLENISKTDCFTSVNAASMYEASSLEISSNLRHDFIRLLHIKLHSWPDTRMYIVSGSTSSHKLDNLFNWNVHLFRAFLNLSKLLASDKSFIPLNSSSLKNWINKAL